LLIEQDLMEAFPALGSTLLTNLQRAKCHLQDFERKTIVYDCSAAGYAGFAERSGAKSALKASRLLFLLASKGKEKKMEIS
jgi:hypothetical protein